MHQELLVLACAGAGCAAALSVAMVMHLRLSARARIGVPEPRSLVRVLSSDAAIRAAALRAAAIEREAAERAIQRAVHYESLASSSSSPGVHARIHDIVDRTAS